MCSCSSLTTQHSRLRTDFGVVSPLGSADGVLGELSAGGGLVLSAAIRAAIEEGVRSGSGVAGDSCTMHTSFNVS